MRLIFAARERVNALLFGRRADAETAEEMQHHLEMEADRLVRESGLDPQEAWRQASIALGGVDKYREQVRDARGFGWLTGMGLDFRLGGRMLLKYPGLTLIGGFVLAGAIAIGAGLFETGRETLYPTLPFEDGDRIVRVELWDAETSRAERRLLDDFMRWREQLTSITDLTAYRSFERNVVGSDGTAQPVTVAEIGASAFQLTRVPPLFGRPLSVADEQPGAPPVVVLGHDVWQRRFNADRGIVGRTVQLGAATPIVVGVMPDGFGFPLSHNAWVPLRIGNTAAREGASVQVVGRLTPGATFASAQSELDGVAARAASQGPATHEHLRLRLRAFAGLDPGEPIGADWLLGLVFVVFLLTGAGANVATLVFARTAMRESEIVVRNALGASRRRILAQLFIEALVLSSVAAAFGLLLAAIGLRFMWYYAVEVLQVPQPFWWNGDIEWPTVVFAAVLAVLGAAVVGLLPAIRATGPRIATGLKNLAGGEAGTSMRFGGAWSVIIVLQVAFTVLCFPLAIGVATAALRDLITRSSFPSESYLTFRPELDRDGANGASENMDADTFDARFDALYGELRRRLEEDPRVLAVTFGSALPGTEHPDFRMEAQSGSEVPQPINASAETEIAFARVDPGFFDAFDIPLLAGRAFHAGDVAAADSTVIVNESLARSLGGSPLGVRIRRTAEASDVEPGPWYEIVGVVRNLNMEPTTDGEAGFVYRAASPAAVYPPIVAVRVSGDAAALDPHVRTLAVNLDPALRLYEVLPLAEVVRRRELVVVAVSLFVTGIVAIAVLLSAAGLFALMALAVARRTREIGIRRALGATSRRLLADLFRRAATQLGLGIILGNILIVLLVSTIGSGFQIEVILPMIAVSLTMVLVGLIACVVPARRALRIQPTSALKEG